jgi:hypothetical protein
MKWFENNPFGVAIAAVAAVLVLIAAILGLSWSRPVDTELGAAEAPVDDAPSMASLAVKLGPEESYEVINDRPLFNESRRPEEPAPVEEPVEEVAEAVVSDPPDVRLTGVVITPEDRFVSLTPSGGGEPLMLRQGAALEGEYAGWNVDGIDPRGVRLKSARGQSYELELDVYDKPIKEPPKPEQPTRVAEEGEEAEGDEDRMSRAEEIRQRIAERREQLRAEAEAEEQDQEAASTNTRSAYQNAIRSMIQSSKARKEEESESDDDL